MVLKLMLHLQLWGSLVERNMSNVQRICITSFRYFAYCEWVESFFLFLNWFVLRFCDNATAVSCLYEAIGAGPHWAAPLNLVSRAWFCLQTAAWKKGEVRRTWTRYAQLRLFCRARGYGLGKVLLQHSLAPYACRFCFTTTFLFLQIRVHCPLFGNCSICSLLYAANPPSLPHFCSSAALNIIPLWWFV